MNRLLGLTYDYAVDLDADTAGAHVVRMVGQCARILEIGAGAGAITRELAKRRCDLVAVEQDEAALAKLLELCPRAFKADLNRPDWRLVLSAEPAFDVIVAADVFEHLMDPQRVLAELKTLLATGGHVVVSLPHAGHLAIVACLLDEDFQYRQWGLLDETHIRFFGIKNIQSLFDRAGLHIVDADAVVRRPERTEFGRKWQFLPQPLREQLEAYNPFGLVYQIVVKATAEQSEVRSQPLAELLARKMAIRAGQRLPFRARVKESVRGFVRARFGDRTVGWLRMLAARGRLR